MARVIQCPNLLCGRTSQLGEDPLGRIFRCPRCLTKLPTAEANAADSGWTNVLGPLPRRAIATASGWISAPGPSTHRFVRTSLSWDHVSVQLARSTSVASARQVYDSGEFTVSSDKSQEEASWDIHNLTDTFLPESGEVYVGPFKHEDCSEWNRQAGDRTSSNRQANDPPEGKVSDRSLGIKPG